MIDLVLAIVLNSTEELCDKALVHSLQYSCYILRPSTDHPLDVIVIVNSSHDKKLADSQFQNIVINAVFANGA